MNKIILGLLALLIVTPSFAKDVYVHGYVKQDGTYVAPYHRSSPNTTVDDNYSTRGNINPYTYKQGTEPRSYERTGSPESSTPPSSQFYKRSGLGDI